MSGIECYYPDLRGTKKEIFQKNANDIIELIFDGGVFKYSVSENNGSGTCNTTAYGSYGLDYSSADDGEINYSSITNSAACSINMQEVTIPTNSNIPFGFISASTYTNGMDWKVASGVLLIELSTGFKGSSVSLFCNSSCVCFGKYSKSN